MDCLLNLACGIGLLSFVMNNPFAKLVSIQVKLFANVENFAKEMYVLLKQLDEIEVFLCFGRLFAKLADLSKDRVD